MGPSIGKKHRSILGYLEFVKKERREQLTGLGMLDKWVCTQMRQVETFAGLNKLHDKLDGRKSDSATKADQLLLACRIRLAHCDFSKYKAEADRLHTLPVTPRYFLECMDDVEKGIFRTNAATARFVNGRFNFSWLNMTPPPHTMWKWDILTSNQIRWA